MAELGLIDLACLLLQPQASPTWSNAVRFTVISAAFLTVVSVLAFYIIRSVKPKNDTGVKAQLDAEFEKTKDALLLAATAKKQRQEAEESTKREFEVEGKERELLRENVDAGRVIGQTDPLSGLVMEADMELIIDPYTGQGYLLPSFLNDWPPETERPRFVYRHPQGTVVKTTDLLRSL